MSAEMEKKLKLVIEKIIQHSNFKTSDTPVNIEDWTSLNHLRITLEINDQFGVSLDPSDISMFEDLKKLLTKLS